MEKKEELPNIDLDDEGNQLAVVEFVEDIYSFYRKTEVKRKNKLWLILSKTYIALIAKTKVTRKNKYILLD